MPHCCHFTPRKEPWYPLYRKLGGPQTSSGHFGHQKKKKLLLLPGFEAQIVQSVAWSLYWILCGILKNCITGPSSFWKLPWKSFIPARHMSILSHNCLKCMVAARWHTTIFCSQFPSVLNKQFLIKCTGQDGALVWPPSAPDLTSLDLFLWGYVMKKIYQDTISDLQTLWHQSHHRGNCNSNMQWWEHMAEDNIVSKSVKQQTMTMLKSGRWN
jgi:hypothetical protein